VSKLFVSNLEFYKVSETELRDAFEKYGEVRDVRVIRRDERSRGFAFIVMATHEDADRAMKELNGTDFFGRPISVVEARDESKR
jgi:cold-inducible RNA-binding protein